MSGTDHPGELAIPAVRAIAPYVPGKPVSELERELGIANIIKLASNENPLGPGPHALEAMRQALLEAWVYPDGSGHALKQVIQQRLGPAPDRVTLGNGSNDLIVLLAEAFLGPGTEAVYSQYCFAVYPLATAATGARGIAVPALPRSHPSMPLGHDLAAMRAAIRPSTRLVFIANPNNPTGTWLLATEVREFLASVPATTLVVLDEAYYEYAVEAGCGNALEWLDEFPNLVVLRTFSKAHGLAALRVGFAASHPEVADVLGRIRQPFNVNAVALAGAAAALADPVHLGKSVALVARERPRVASGLASLGLGVIPSAGNFVLVDLGDSTRAATLDAFLLRRGVIVRPVGNYGLGTFLRITIGLAEENDRLLAETANWLREAGR